MIQNLHPYPVEYLVNPDQKTLRDLALSHTPAVFKSDVGNLNKVSRNKARMAKYTYIIDEDSESGRYSHQVMPPQRAAEIIARQERYIKTAGKMIDVRGYLGVGPRAVGVQWLYTLEGANIAGMQSVLAFPTQAVAATFTAQFRVVYTPNLQLDDMPGKQAILVDLKNYTTYIIGPDYFGESKKAALRMLNASAYDQGGLVLHAGAKSVQINGTSSTMTIMGLSGTGKTTTTFSKQGEVTRPIQDDMVVLWPRAVALLWRATARHVLSIPPRCFHRFNDATNLLC